MAADIKANLKRAKNFLARLEKGHADCKSEIIKIIRGESNFSAGVLNRLIAEIEAKIKKTAEEISGLQLELDNGNERVDALQNQFDNILSWAEIYDRSSMETKKMIVSNLIKTVRVSRDYNVEIDFRISLEDFISDYAYENDITENELVTI